MSNKRKLCGTEWEKMHKFAKGDILHLGGMAPCPQIRQCVGRRIIRLW